MAPRGNRKILDALVKQAVEHLSKSGSTPEFLKTRFEKMIYHVMPNHPYAATSYIVTNTYKCLVPEASKEQVEKAEVLGWIWQMFQASYVMFDDMIDRDEKRHGRPTWSGLNNHRVSSLSFDFILFNSTIFYLLEKHFGQMGPPYMEMVRYFHQTLLESTKGNQIETAVSVMHGQKYESSEVMSFAQNFNLSDWELYAEQKFSVHIKLPILLAMILAGIQSVQQPEVIEVANRLVQMSSLLDDYFDIFTLHHNNDTKFTDARRGQLSFLWVAAKQLCNEPEEWNTFLDTYGRDDPKCFAWIKDFMERIGVPEMFKGYKENLYKEIENAIQTNFGDNYGIAAALRWNVGFLNNATLDELGQLDKTLEIENINGDQ